MTPDDFLQGQDKPTVEQTAWVIAHYAGQMDHLNDGGVGTFRYLIYNRMGYGPEAYRHLYEAGGMRLNDALYTAEEIEALEAHLSRMRRLLSATTLALKGFLPAQAVWSWYDLPDAVTHDLPEIARALKDKATRGEILMEREEKRLRATWSRLRAYSGIGFGLATYFLWQDMLTEWWLGWIGTGLEVISMAFFGVLAAFANQNLERIHKNDLIIRSAFRLAVWLP